MRRDGSLLNTAKLLQTGMKEPVTPMFASFLICRSPARPWICWMVSAQFQNRVRPLPMFPPLGEIGVGPLMEMSWLAKKSSASPRLMPKKLKPSIQNTWNRLNPS